MNISGDQARTLAIRCSCGALGGRAQDLPSDDGPRLICYCDDCQAFAHFLGRADDILDDHGGTDIFQMSLAHLRIDEGVDHLACMRLKPKGLLRWYTSCCRTPIGATPPTQHLSFLGLNHACIGVGDDRASLDDLLGPIQGGVFGRFAKGDRSGLRAHRGAPVSLIVQNIGKILKRGLRGDHKHTPFFDSGTGKPVATPTVLGDTERQRLDIDRET